MNYYSHEAHGTDPVTESVNQGGTIPSDGLSDGGEEYTEEELKTIEKESYVERAWKLIPSDHLNDRERESIDSLLRHCFDDGFTLVDAVLYAKLTEEVSPHLSEEYACNKIAGIVRKYRKSKRRKN